MSLLGGGSATSSVINEIEEPVDTQIVTKSGIHKETRSSPKFGYLSRIHNDGNDSRR